MKAQDINMFATIKDSVKEELGNKDGFYDGNWIIMKIDWRYSEIELSNGRVAIFRKFDEVDITIKS